MRHLLIAGLMFPLAAFAAAPPAQPVPIDSGAAWQGRDRGVGLAQALNLSEPDAQRMGETIQQYEVQRRPLHQQLRAAHAILRRAADGDPSVAGQVDAMIQQMNQAKTQLAAVNQQMFAALSANLSAQQRAKMALMLGHGGHQGMGRFGKRGAN